MLSTQRPKQHPHHKVQLLLTVLILLFPIFLTHPASSTAQTARFSDVSPTSSAAEAITQLASKGILNGYTDGRFGPDDTLQRVQAAAVICRAMGWNNESYTHPFRDLPEGLGQAGRNIATLFHYQVVLGYADGTFRPTLPVTTVQAISLISRSMIKRGLWQVQPDTAQQYATLPEPHRNDVATYVHYAGQLPTAPHQDNLAWNQPITRAAFAQDLWQVLRHHPQLPQSTVPAAESMPLGDLPGWQQIFADDFTTPLSIGSFPGGGYEDRWSVYEDGAADTAGQSGGPSRYFPSRVVSVHDGVLDKYLHLSGQMPVAAALLPKISAPQTYGRYAVRFRADPIPGFKVAWLLWPDSGIWPAEGEIDFPEGDLDGSIQAFMHYRGATSGSEQAAFNTRQSFSDWHTAVIEWTPTAVTFFLDGQIIGQSRTHIPDQPMHFVLQTETSLTTFPSAGAEGHVYVDWIAIYRYAP